MLEKIGALVRDGALVAGAPPLKSPSLSGYPECDRRVNAMAEELWGGFAPPPQTAVRRVGRGRILWGGEIGRIAEGEIYPAYGIIAAFLEQDGVRPDFAASGAFRYAHRTLAGREVYFVSNRTDLPVRDTCLFRDGTLSAELWDAAAGAIRPLVGQVRTARGTALEIRLEPFESCFVVFAKDGAAAAERKAGLPGFSGLSDDRRSGRALDRGFRSEVGRARKGRLRPPHGLDGPSGGGDPLLFRDGRLFTDVRSPRSGGGGGPRLSLGLSAAALIRA